MGSLKSKKKAKKTAKKTFDKESYTYYGKMHAAQKSYYTKKGWYDLIPIKMNKTEWTHLKQTTGASNSEIIYDEFHAYNKKTVESLMKAAKEYGIKVKKSELARGQNMQEIYDLSEKMYSDFKQQGINSDLAKAGVSHSIWGSP